MKAYYLAPIISFIFLSPILIAQSPLFPNSVVSNDIDFILETDTDDFESITFLGLEDKEMPGDPNGGGLFDTNSYVFEASFGSNHPSIEIWCHSAFQNQDAAKGYADKLGPRLGKLPAFQRNMINHVVIHNGDGGAFAEIEGQFFILYSENMDKRISTNDLEETVFHESVHASYQFMYNEDPDWLAAQAADPTYVTEYAQDYPNLEDLAETALFAYVYHTYPGRLESDIELWLEQNIPNRLEFFKGFYVSVTNIKDAHAMKDVHINPNPTHSLFTVSSETPITHPIQLYNLSGQRLKTYNSEKSKKLNIDLSHFESGLYILKIAGYKEVPILKF